MLNLILAILSSFSIVILIKINESQDVNRLVVLGMNYVFASLVGWGFALFNFPGEIEVITVLMGLAGGILWPTTFFMFMWGIKNYGLSVTGSLARLSLSVPVVIALIFLNEILTWQITAGLAATFIAFFLINPIRKRELGNLDFRAFLFFPMLIFWLGMVDFWVNLFNIIGNTQQKYLFMAFIFTFACLFVWIVVFVKRIPVERRALARGLYLGLPNYFSTFFLLAALRAVEFENLSMVVYSVYSVAIISLSFVAGAVIWKEKVSLINTLGLGFAIAAIVLLNMA